MELFSEHFEGTLSGGLKQEFERHLAENPASAHEYAVFCELMGSFNSLPAVPVPADLGEQISRQLDKADWDKKQARKPGAAWLRFGLLAASAACVAVIGFVSYKSINGGATASLITTSPKAEPMSVVRVGSEIRVRLVPTTSSTVRVLRGGLDLGFPPSDAAVVREETVAAKQPLNIPLTDSGENRQIVYIAISGHDEHTAVIYPGTKASPEGVLANLCEISTKHDVVITITAKVLGVGGALQQGDLGMMLDKVLEGTGLSYTKKDGIVEIK